MSAGVIALILIVALLALPGSDGYQEGKTVNAWKIIAINIVVFYVTYRLWLRAEAFDNDGEISKSEAVFVALVDTVAVTICMII